MPPHSPDASFGRYSAFCSGEPPTSRVHRERHIGGRTHFAEGHADNARQTLTTERGVRFQRRPTTFDERLVSFLEALRRRHRIVGPPFAALLVADRIQRREHLRRELCGLIKDLLDDIQRGISETWQASVLINRKDVAEYEQMLPERRLVAHASAMTSC